MQKTEAFELNSRLQADTHRVAALPLSDLLLMNNAAVPWLILVPRVPGCEELTDLTLGQQHQLLEEINTAHRLLAPFKPLKINTGALGNIVRQLHVHVIARFAEDAAWPGPVWGNLPASPYSQGTLVERMAQLRKALEDKPPL